LSESRDIVRDGLVSEIQRHDDRKSAVAAVSPIGGCVVAAGDGDELLCHA
jgi:hypothetical protein